MSSYEKRTHATQLPSAGELTDILGQEAQRPLPPGKEEAHYADFSPFIQLCEELGLDPALVSEDHAPDVATEIVGRGKSLVDTLVIRVLDDPEPLRAALRGIYAHLSEEDVPRPSDLMFVFGTKALTRAEKAIELYRLGLAPLILVAGGSPYYDDRPISEAETYKQLMVEAGIPADVIVTESRSLTIPDNVRSGLNLLDEKEVTLGSVIAVNSPYSQRRGWIHLRKYLPDTFPIYRVNAPTKPEYGPERWYRSEAGLRTYLNEFLKMKVAVTLNTA